MKPEQIIKAFMCCEKEACSSYPLREEYSCFKTEGEMKKSKIIEAWKCCVGNGSCNNCPVPEDKKEDCVCVQYLLEEALKLYQREKKDIVHKTLASVKIKCQRVTYPDNGATKEIFMVEAKDLDEIEKSILGGHK